MTKETNPPIFEKPVCDYLRIMTASPEVAVADPAQNFEYIATAYAEACEKQAELLVLPELGVTAYSAADMFFNRHVLEQTTATLCKLADLTQGGPALVVGAPLEQNGVLYNCGVVLAQGKIAGVVPKTYLPNYNEFYEQRWFTSGKGVDGREIKVSDEIVPFGTDLLFDINGTRVGVEICEDGWASISPGTHAALQGAEVIVNLSASNELTSKANFRRKLVTDHASRLLCAYAYTSAGKGESNADVVYSGHQLISEGGRLEKEVEPFATGSLVFDVDRTYIQADRNVNTTYGNEANDARTNHIYRTVQIITAQPTDNMLYRKVEAKPFGSKQNCEEVFGIISRALTERIYDINAQGVVIGLSGGLDSTLALLVAVESARKAGKPLGFVHTIGMPGMASSERTQNNAALLAQAFRTTHKTIPINDLAHSALDAIGHDKTTEDITFENTQARMRTLLLMNYANMVGGFVQGTGDMSEAAQGWCTFNGDHMSMYNPNGNVFKSMVKDLVGWYRDEIATDDQVKLLLSDILATIVSPELTGTGDLSQSTDETLGPVDLRDFFHIEFQRHRDRPTKIGYLATVAFAGKYEDTEIATWLDKFLDRYITSQNKRDVMPNSPMVGPVGVSPRGPLRLATNISRGWRK